MHIIVIPSCKPAFPIHASELVISGVSHPSVAKITPRSPHQALVFLHPLVSQSPHGASTPLPAPAQPLSQSRATPAPLMRGCAPVATVYVYCVEGVVDGGGGRL